MATIERHAVASRRNEELTTARIAPPRRTELTRVEHHQLHLQAVGLSAQFREFFPNVVRPSYCPFDHRHDPPAGTLAALMRAHTNQETST
jgi:hypothetical protein